MCGGEWAVVVVACLNKTLPPTLTPHTSDPGRPDNANTSSLTHSPPNLPGDDNLHSIQTWELVFALIAQGRRRLTTCTGDSEDRPWA